jgi:hypothetical protein
MRGTVYRALTCFEISAREECFTVGSSRDKKKVYLKDTRWLSLVRLSLRNAKMVGILYEKLATIYLIAIHRQPRG